MRIHVLMENSCCRDDLAAEHGLSLLIETAGTTVLFDTGASPAFADNAARMGVDLRAVDVAVLSHGHYDHGGGIPRFLELNAHAPVWVSERAFEPHYNAQGKDIGLHAPPATHPRLRRPGAEPVQLAPHVTLWPAVDMPCPHAPEGRGMHTLVNDERREDDFLHEQYLLIQEEEKRILFSGCSHKGILNIMNWLTPDVLIGGLHFSKIDCIQDEEALRFAAASLKEYSTKYYTGHCTGAEQYAFLKAILGEQLECLGTGVEFVI
jgi:7,8-dihydropterin-6-yl-methyl-4-(beta-D-ribofuranosyl)aminobenzene 5'-phosphate synthase